MIDRYVVVDLETTGFSPAVNEIIQVAGLKVEKGKIVDKFASYVKPIRYIPRAISDLTGITNDDVEFAPHVGEVLEEFHKFCGDYVFVGHNLPFDYRFLCKYGSEEAMVDFSLKKTRRGIDTLKLAREYLNLKSNKLCDVAVACDIDVDENMHDARVDCAVTKAVYTWFRFHYYKEDLLLFPQYLDKRDELVGKAVDNGTLEFT